MKKILFIFFTVSIFTTSSTQADNCPAGQYYETSSGCTDCSTGFYCTGDNSKRSCPSSHPKSNEKATAQNQCYKDCKEEPIDNGKKIPTNPTASYNTSCEFTISCDSTSDKCNGYHEDNGQCIANKQACTKSLTFNGTHNGFKFWENNNYTDCYITECTGDRHLEELVTICSTQYGQDCATNRGNCTEKLGNCTGNISGNYSWENKYKYDNCICETTNTDSVGEYSTKCHRTANEGDRTQWGNCETTAVKCIAGYCANTTDKCTPAKNGYYHSNANNATCEPCPMGSTSPSGATDKTSCYITTSTKFCDGDGTKCFTLPGNATKKFFAN